MSIIFQIKLARVGVGKEVTTGWEEWVMGNYGFVARVSLSNDESFWKKIDVRIPQHRECT